MSRKPKEATTRADRSAELAKHQPTGAALLIVHGDQGAWFVLRDAEGHEAHIFTTHFALEMVERPFETTFLDPYPIMRTFATGDRAIVTDLNEVPCTVWHPESGMRR